MGKLTGEQAVEFLQDYPLYASTDGISHELAIKLAEVMIADGWAE